MSNVEKKMVLFTRPCSPYLKGETASFLAKDAKIFVDRGIAVYTDTPAYARANPEVIQSSGFQDIQREEPQVVDWPEDPVDEVAEESEDELVEDEDNADDEQDDDDKPIARPKKKGKSGRARRRVTA